jgi:hypothetical protein
MSRTFVKDADENLDELPARPISSHPNLVTVEGLAAIEATFTRLQQEHARARPRSGPPSAARRNHSLTFARYGNAMLGMNMLRAIAGGRLATEKRQAPVETPEVRRMYAFANTADPRLIKLLKLVEELRTDRLRRGLFLDRRSH